jgi:hypothetical protein
MPLSVLRSFTDPDQYFARIRNLQIDGLVLRPGEFRAESTRIDLHRLSAWRTAVPTMSEMFSAIARVMRRLEEVLAAISEEPLYMADLSGRWARPIGHFVTVAWSTWA